MRIWQLVALTALLGFFALATGWKPLYILAYALLLALILSAVWMALNLRGTAFARTTPVTRAQVGERLEEQLSLT
jgi:hypothetical protein